MSKYTVFLPAPSFKELKLGPDFAWKTTHTQIHIQEDVASSPHLPNQSQPASQAHEQDGEENVQIFSQLSLSEDTPQAMKPQTQASEQYSELYANDIFMKDEEENDEIDPIEQDNATNSSGEYTSIHLHCGELTDFWPP
jgi:hypothetical protein